MYFKYFEGQKSCKIKSPLLYYAKKWGEKRVLHGTYIFYKVNLSQPVNYFVYDGAEHDSCNLIIPEGYSVFISDFILGAPKAPENFVFFNGRQDRFLFTISSNFFLYYFGISCSFFDSGTAKIIKSLKIEYHSPLMLPDRVFRPWKNLVLSNSSHVLLDHIRRREFTSRQGGVFKAGVDTFKGQFRELFFCVGVMINLLNCREMRS